MTRIHAFVDDALGDRDAVGLVDALRAGDVSAAELVEAAIARLWSAMSPIRESNASVSPSARNRL